jgi:hypothetical protein
LSNHPGYDGTVAKLKALAAAPAGANPFVSGQPVVDRAMRVLNTCARAQKARFLIAAAGGAGEVYASTSGAREGAPDEVAQQGQATGAPVHASLRDEGGYVAAGVHPGGHASAEVPLVFPHSAHADDHAGLCAHGEQ